MNKQDNKLALSVLATLTAAIALIYTLIMYYHIIFAVIGMSLLFLITAFILTRNLITFSTMKNKSLNVQLKNYIDDISAQLETMGGAQSQIGKATYLYTKQAAQAVTTLENNYIESQEALYKNLASLSNAQIKTSKLILRNDQNNAIKITTSIKDMNSQLRDTITQGFDRLHPDHPELITTLEEIVHYLKKQPDGMNQELQLQLNHITQELQNIFNSIQQIPTQAVMQTTPVTTGPTAMAPIEETASITDMSPVEEAVSATDITPTDEPTSVADITPADEPASTADITSTEKTPSPDDPSPAEEVVSTIDATTTDEPESLTDTNPAEAAFSKTDILSVEETALSADTTFEPITEPDSTNKGANDMLSADEIATLFAASEHTTILNTEADQSAAIDDLNNDSGKQMSEDEIAALFAAAEPAPKKKNNSSKSSTEINPEPAKTEPAATDLNRQLSADEIAALFATMG